MSDPLPQLYTILLHIAKLLQMHYSKLQLAQNVRIRVPPLAIGMMLTLAWWVVSYEASGQA
jgi:hypothetical protein